MLRILESILSGGIWAKGYVRWQVIYAISIIGCPARVRKAAPAITS